MTNQVPSSKEEHYEQVRQALWHYLQDNPTPLSTIAKELKIARQTVENFVYSDGRTPEARTICRIQRFVKDKYEERDDKQISTRTNES